MNRIFFLIPIAILFCTGCPGPTRIHDYPRPPQFDNFLQLKAGERAPDFELQSIENETWRLSDQQGRIVILQIGSATSPAFVQSLDDFHREVLVPYLMHPDVQFVYVFSQEAHPELLPEESLEMLRNSPEAHRRAMAARYYYRLRFTNATVLHDLSGLIPAATNVVILFDDSNNTVGELYGYGRGGTTSPAFLIGRDGTLLSKALYTLHYLSPAGYQAGNLPMMIQAWLRADSR